MIRRSSKSGLSVRWVGSCFGESLIDERVEAAVEGERHQRRWRVVGGEIASFRRERIEVGLSHSDGATLDGRWCVGDAERVVEERLVDRAQLLDAEVAVVDVEADVADLDGGERTDRIGNVAIRDGGSCEVWGVSGVEQLAVEGVHAECGGETRVVKRVEGPFEPFPEVMTAAFVVAGLGCLAECGEAVGVPVQIARSGEHVALLGKQEEQRPVEHGKKLAVERPTEVGLLEHACPQVGVGVERPVGELLDGPTNLWFQALPGRHACGERLLVQAFEQAVGVRVLVGGGIAGVGVWPCLEA